MVGWGGVKGTGGVIEEGRGGLEGCRRGEEKRGGGVMITSSKTLKVSPLTDPVKEVERKYVPTWKIIWRNERNRERKNENGAKKLEEIKWTK